MVKSRIQQKLAESLDPAHLEVINESHLHSVPPGSESHFKVVIVSEAFSGMNRVRRHQTVNDILNDELAGPVHALSMQTHTRDEWRARGGAVMASPQCLGGSKADAS
ncbi:MAG: BolA/IbaG family iron-sulfur metabolism protein [Rhodospirillaceae bacterium]